MSPLRKVKGDGEDVCELEAKSLGNAAGTLEEDVEGGGHGRNSRGFGGKHGGEWTAGQTRIPAMRFMRWQRETATIQKESTRSWFVRAGGSSGACDKMGEGEGEGGWARAQQWKEQMGEEFKEGSRMHRKRRRRVAR